MWDILDAQKLNFRHATYKLLRINGQNIYSKIGN